MASKFGEVYKKMLTKAKLSNNRATKLVGIDSQQAGYWMTTGEAPDRILALIKAVKEEADLSWDEVGALIDKAFK